MTLDPQQMAATADDLRTNLTRAGLSTEELTSWLGLDEGALRDILAMTGEADPATVWLVRDAIEATLREEGDVGDWSELTDANRMQAQQWFSLRELPAR